MPSISTFASKAIFIFPHQWALDPHEADPLRPSQEDVYQALLQSSC